MSLAAFVMRFGGGVRTRVQIPPAPPNRTTKAANDIQLAAFFIEKLNNILFSDAQRDERNRHTQVDRN